MPLKIFNIWARCENKPTTRTTLNSRWTILAPRKGITIIKCRPIRIKLLIVSRKIATTISFNRCREIITPIVKLIPNSISISFNQALQTTTTSLTNTITQLSILPNQELINRNRRYYNSSYRKYSVAHSLRMSPIFTLLTIAGLN